MPPRSCTSRACDFALAIFFLAWPTRVVGARLGRRSVAVRSASSSFARFRGIHAVGSSFGVDRLFRGAQSRLVEEFGIEVRELQVLPLGTRGGTETVLPVCRDCRLAQVAQAAARTSGPKSDGCGAGERVSVAGGKLVIPFPLTCSRFVLPCSAEW